MDHASRVELLRADGSATLGRVPRLRSARARGKHFVLNQKFKQPNEVREGWVQPGWMQQDWYQRGGLDIVLNPNEAAIFGVERVSALDLAAEIVAFWESDLKPRQR